MLMAEEEVAFSPDQIRDFIIAAHGNLPRVREMLANHPGLLNLRHYWSTDDSETAIQAAAQVGSAPVVEYLLNKGAPLEICTAAMLGRMKVVEQMLDEDPSLIEARGAHGIPLMPHAAMGNNLELAKMLFEQGATAGMSHALGNAVTHGDARMARWILETGQADLKWKDYEGKSLMAIAKGTGKRHMVELLREHGAQ
jgi:ankyrin repeat protein